MCFGVSCWVEVVESFFQGRGRKMVLGECGMWRVQRMRLVDWPQNRESKVKTG